MYSITLETMTEENFKEFGTFASVLDPKGNCLFGNYYGDNQIYAASSTPITFSPLVVTKPQEYIVTETECHNYGFEGVMCLDDDVVMHVAPPSVEPCPEKTRAFLVPKGTMVVLTPGVWHKAVMPVNLDTAHVLIILPMRTYAVDSCNYDYSEQDQIRISL